MQILPDRIIFDIDDWLGAALSPLAGTTIKVLGEQGHLSHSIYNPLDNAKSIPGVASSGNGLAALTNVDSNSPLSTIIDAVSDFGRSGAEKSYGLNTTQIEEWSVASDTLTVSGGTFPHTITPHGHSNLTASECQIVDYNRSGTARLFYSWGDGTDWDVGIYDYVTTFDDDFMSTVPTTPLAGADLTGGTGVPHPLYVSIQDGFLYMGSSRYVHSYDGLNDTFNAEVFDVGPGMEVAGFAETQYDLVIFANTKGAASSDKSITRAYFWDQSRPSSAYKIVEIEAYRISAPFRYMGTVGCFGIGQDADLALHLYNGSDFERVAYFDATSIPVNGGVTIHNGLLKFNAAGKIFSWGKYKNLISQTQNAYHIATLGGTDSGLCKQLFANRVYMSSETGELSKFSGFGQGTFISKSAFPNFPKGMKGKVTEVDVEFALPITAATNDTITVNLYINGITTTVISAYNSTTQTTKRAMKNSSGNALPTFTGVAVGLSWNAGSTSTDSPMIKRVTVWYEPHAGTT